MKLYQWASLLMLVFASTAFSEAPAEVDGLPLETAIQIMRDRTVPLDESDRAAFSGFVEGLPESTRDQLATDWSADSESDVAFVDLVSIAEAEGSRPLLHGLIDHPDPMVRLLSLCQLTAGGDEEAARQLHRLFHDAALPVQEARLIRTYSTGIGLHAAEETPESILTHLTAMFGAEPLLKPGDPAPLFDVKDVNGNPLKLEALRGRIVVLHFWATWCGPCIGKMPSLKRKLERFDPESVVVIGVSLDQDQNALTEAIERFDMPWHDVFDGRGWGGELGRAYGVSAVPTDVIIDRQGLVYSNAIEDVDRLLADGDTPD